MKDERVTVRLDSNTSFELQELCKDQKVGLSTMIRTLIKRSLNEIRDRYEVDASKKKST